MALTHADVRRILDILDHATHLETLEVRIGDFLLRAAKPGATLSPQASADAVAPAVPVAAASPAAPSMPAGSAPEPAVPAGMLALRAPMVGTFYRRPKPEEPAFVEEGARVEAGAPLCLVEAMKMFNTVPAPAAGRVVRIVAEDKQLVQRDALLMIIEPESRA